jgi:hypothetical protein
MKATMESTDKMLIIQGLNFRVWEGTTEKGTKFVALVNRLAATDPEKQGALVQETLPKNHKPADANSLATLEAMGIS